MKKEWKEIINNFIQDSSKGHEQDKRIGETRKEYVTETYSFVRKLFLKQPHTRQSIKELDSYFYSLVSKTIKD